MSFPCPTCGSPTRTVDVRLPADRKSLKRRHECRGDGKHRFNTEEFIEGTTISTNDAVAALNRAVIAVQKVKTDTFG